MFGMGAPELVIILLLVVLLFGAAKIPELGRSIGAGLSNFKRGLKEGDGDGASNDPLKPDVKVRDASKRDTADRDDDDRDRNA
jgi:sec-independent protein translocase protein TatA